MNTAPYTQETKKKIITSNPKEIDCLKNALLKHCLKFGNIPNAKNLNQLLQSSLR